MVALLLAGLLTYLGLWLDNDVAPNPNHAGEWRSCPWWLHRFVRRDAGVPLVRAMFVELAGLATAAVALVSLAAVVPAVLRPLGACVIVVTWVVALLSFIAVEVRARFRL